MIDRCLQRLPAPPRAERILVIRLGALGDVLRTLPAVAGLRAHYSGARLCWLVEERAAGAVEGQCGVDDVLHFPRRALSAALRDLRWGRAARLARDFQLRLRRERFDLVLDFHSILKSGVLARASRAPVRVAYARPFGREGAWFFANRLAHLAPKRISRFERNESLVRFLGIDPGCAHFRFHVLPEAARALGSVASKAAVIHPGSSAATPYKRYDPAALGAVARALRQRTGMRSLVAAGPDAAEQALARTLIVASEGAAVAAPQTPRVADLAALLEGAALFIGADSGPLHLASLVGTPVVQIVGPTDPVENSPFPGTPARQVREALACSPCRRGCAAADCMRGVAPERVVDAALELLREGFPRPTASGPALHAAGTAP